MVEGAGEGALELGAGAAGENPPAHEVVQAALAFVGGRIAVAATGLNACGRAMTKVDQPLVSEDPIGLGHRVLVDPDALAEPRVAILAEIPTDSHPPIRYPAAILTDAPAAGQFMTYLTGPAAQAVFDRLGFVRLER